MRRLLLLGLCLALLLVPLTPAEAVRLFTCGFEENNVTSSTMWTSNSGGVAVTAGTTSPHSGTYRGDTGSTANSSFVRRALASNVTSGTVYTRGYFSSSTVAPSGNIDLIRELDSTNATLAVAVTLLTTGKLRLFAGSDSTTADSTAALTANTWYRIELRVLVSDTVGELELRYYLGDSTTPVQTLGPLTSKDTNPGAGLNLFQFGKNQSVSGTISMDDIAINDDSGSFQNSWAGPGKIALMKPDGDTSVFWTKAGSTPAATNFGGVSEVPGAPDDGVTYNEDSGTTNVDELSLSDLPAEVTSNATIILADYYTKTQAGANSQVLRLRMWDDTGTPTDGPTIALTNGSWTIATTSQHQVFDTTGKSKAALNAFSAGYVGSSGASAKRVTTLWVNVEWIEATSTGGGGALGILLGGAGN